jgi:hypothetical protein
LQETQLVCQKANAEKGVKIHNVKPKVARCQNDAAAVLCNVGQVAAKLCSSHTPEEWADREAIGAGATVIYQAVTDLDRSLTVPLKGSG